MKVTFIKDLLDYLKENSPAKLRELNLETISDYINYQPYYIPEFPENTPLVSCYHLTSIQDEVEWKEEYELDLYLYFEKNVLSEITEKMELYANILKELLLDYCMKPQIDKISYNTYYAETNYYLVSVSIKFNVYD